MVSIVRMLLPGGSGRVRLFAVLVAGCVVVGACGAGDEQPAGEVTIGEVLSGEADPGGVAGPEFGDTIEDWSEELAADGEAVRGSQVVNDYPEGFELIGWEDLVPPGFSGDEIAGRYADRLAALEDGSPEADAIYAEMRAEYDSIDFVNEELDGAKVNLAGFVAPLTYEDDIVTEFLLVPYFGACIHVPAPPANQTVLVTVDKANGLTFDESWGAVWVAGTLTVSSATTDLATASYVMTDATSGVYDEYS